jgi:NAD(P)-dependent dehydrogenase (short-subunit alcohol dehydrogenase family)
MENHVALVTGAAGALGAEVARALAATGYKLALVDGAHAAARLAEVARDVGGAAVAAFDIASAPSWSEQLVAIEHELGAPVSHAALIAGGWRGGKKLFEETDDATYDAMMSSNVTTVYRSLRALLPGMVERGAGSIVVVGARAVERPWTSAGSAAYGASKNAAVALAEAAAAEVLDRGVRINAVLPSTMDTPANRRAMPDVDPAKWVSLASAAGVIAFLLSDAARDVSGAAVPVYGRA